MSIVTAQLEQFIAEDVRRFFLKKAKQAFGNAAAEGFCRMRQRIAVLRKVDGEFDNAAGDRAYDGVGKGKIEGRDVRFENFGNGNARPQVRLDADGNELSGIHRLSLDHHVENDRRTRRRPHVENNGVCGKIVRQGLFEE
jgi:hypothetical protein